MADYSNYLLQIPFVLFKKSKLLSYLAKLNLQYIILHITTFIIYLFNNATNFKLFFFSFFLSNKMAGHDFQKKNLRNKKKSGYFFFSFQTRCQIMIFKRKTWVTKKKKKIRTFKLMHKNIFACLFRVHNIISVLPH